MITPPPGTAKPNAVGLLKLELGDLQKTRATAKIRVDETQRLLDVTRTRLNDQRNRLADIDADIRRHSEALAALNGKDVDYDEEDLLDEL